METEHFCTSCQVAHASKAWAVLNNERHDDRARQYICLEAYQRLPLEYQQSLHMVAPTRGTRTRAILSSYPFKAGTVGRVVDVQVFPHKRFTVRWENPELNYVSDPECIVWSWKYHCFEVLPEEQR